MAEPVLEVDAVRNLAHRLVTPELVVLPIRHHSPASARAVQLAFESAMPSEVLVEGPRSASHLLVHLSHPDARLPLAVYSHARSTLTDEVIGAYFPLCEHSPELMAVRLAHGVGIPVSLCDLDLAEQVLAGRSRPGEDQAVSAEPELGRSAPLRELAASLGCRDHEELWELLFEAASPDPDLAEYVAQVSAYSLCARRGQTAAELADVAAAAREAEMVAQISSALARRVQGSGPVLVVVGGFHAVALPDLLDDPPPRPVLDHELVAGSALIRYDEARLDRLHGYGAGMTSPGWHRRVWEETQRGSGPADARRAAALEVLFDIAGRLRMTAPLPTTRLVAAYEHLLGLVELRGRPAPLRDDVVDAVTSCLIEGDLETAGVRVLAVTQEVLAGNRVGRVPPGVGAPPLVEDVRHRLHQFGLDTDGRTPRTSNLDIYRSAAHRATSRALHGLALLGVPYARFEGGPDFVGGQGLARLREQWTCQWTVETEAALVEASAYGGTLPEAVATAFSGLLADARRDDARLPCDRAVSLLGQALVLGLHDRVGGVVRLVQESLSRDPDFAGVAIAASHLALLHEGREPLEAWRSEQLPDLVAAAYARAVQLGRDLGTDSDSAEGALDALPRLRELVAGAGLELDAEPFWALVADLQRHGSALVRGAATGLRYAEGQRSLDDLASDVAGHLSGTLPTIEAVGFVRGLLATAREALWQDSGLLPSLDRQVGLWHEDVFLEHLPHLRLAFAGLTPRETGRVAGMLVARRTDAGGDSDKEAVVAPASTADAVAATMRHDGLAEWLP